MYKNLYFDTKTCPLDYQVNYFYDFFKINYSCLAGWVPASRGSPLAAWDPPSRRASTARDTDRAHEPTNMAR